MLMGSDDGGVDDQYSKSGSSDIASKMRHQMFLRLHRLKRRNTLFHSPNASGRSRRSRPHNPQHTLDEHAVIAPCRALLVGPPDNQRRDPIPLPIAQH